MDEIEKRVEEEAEKAATIYVRHDGSCESSMAKVVRPLVERIAELEDVNRELTARVQLLAVELTSTRDELTIERQARRTADELASRQTERINALEVRAAEAEENARTTSLHWQQERAEVSNLRGMLTTREMLLRAADKETERQAAYGARLAGMTGERDEALTMMRRYSVSLADQIAANRRLRHELRDAEGGLRAALRMAERSAGERVS